jgi:hypothetical protein
MLDLVDSIHSPADNRRLKPRFAPTFGTICRLLHQPQKQGLVWDISVFGVGLLLGEAPEPGEWIPVELRTETDAAPISISIQAVYSRELTTGDYFVGAKFNRSLSEVEIEPLITPIPAKPYLGVKAGPKTAKGPKRAATSGKTVDAVSTRG